MPKTSKVTLGGREYILTEKVMGVSQKWREKLRQSSVMRIFESLDGAMEQLVSAVNGMDEGKGNLNIIAGINIATIAPAIVRGLTNSIDDVIDLLFDYAPEVGDDREWLAENAYNDELVMAFIEVLKLNFPILALWDLVRGPRVQATSTNLPSTNGATGTKKPSARSKIR
jgi:hypothetical protein